MAVAFLIFTLSSGIGTPAEILIRPGESIQAAVDNASSGDVIIIKPGNYTENIIISTQNLTIRSDSGNPEDTVVMANNPNVNVFQTRANNTTISGFKVKAAKYTDVTGIYLSGCSNCTIANNNLSENSLGIYLSNSKNNTISDNKVNLNEKYGIQLVYSEGNILLNNGADSNHHGIILENNCSYNNLTSNTAVSNRGYGFYLINSSINNLNNNTINKNDMGIYLTNSNMSIISGNNISENIRYGIWVSHSNSNIISGNIISESNWGIHLNSSDNNILSGNILASNDVSGLSMCPACDNNTVFNNYLNNIFNTDIGNKRNAWNIKRTEGTNIVGGPYLGGNFWASPDGTGFSETAPDADENGISDLNYNGTNFTDYLPLVPVSYPQEQILPAVNFSKSVTNVTTSKTVINIPIDPVSTKSSSSDDNAT